MCSRYQKEEKKENFVCNKTRHDEGVRQGGVDLLGSSNGKIWFLHSLEGDDHEMCEACEVYSEAKWGFF